MPKRKKLNFRSKRKTKEQQPKEVDFPARGILAERTNKKGVLEYLVDWEGTDPRTGKDYDHEWVRASTPTRRPPTLTILTICSQIAADNVGFDHTEEWEKRKKKQSRPEGKLPLVVSDIDPVISPAPTSKRAREDSPASSNGSAYAKKRRRVDVVVEIAANPDFDPEDYEYKAVSSQTTIPDSQEPDSFPSLAATIGDHITDKQVDPDLDRHGLRSPTPAPSVLDSSSQHPAEHVFSRSPGLFVSQSPASEPGQRSQVSRTSPRRSASAPTSEQLQPETTDLSFGGRQVVTGTNTQQSLNVAPDISIETTSGTAEHLSSQGFLTQPDFGSESFLVEASPALAVSGSPDIVTDTNDKPSDTGSHQTRDHNSQSSVSGISQSAQVVPQLSSIHEELRNPTQLQSLSSDDNCVIPASSKDLYHQQVLVIASAAAGEQKSASSAAIVPDTPSRQKPSSPGNSSPASAVETGLRADKTPAAQTEQAAVSSVESCTISPATGREVTVTPSAHSRNAPNMDDQDLPDPGDGENIMEYLRALHAKTHRKSKSVERLTYDENPVDDFIVDDEPEKDSEATSTKHQNATFDDAPHLSALNLSPFNSLGLAEPTSAMSMDDEPHHLPATIAPSQLQMFITESSLNHMVPSAGQQLFQSEEVDHETVLPGIESPQISAEPGAQSPSLSISRLNGGGKHLVTLPMLASTRQLYVETLRSNKSAIAKYGAFFTSESAGNPGEKLISEVDNVFQSLHDHCDLPQFVGSIPSMDAKGMTNHATGTNSKFAFVDEFLKQLALTDLRVAVISQPGLAIDYLEAICETAKIDSIALDRYMAVGHERGGLTVVLGTTEMEVFDRPLHGITAVILLDSAARSVWKDHTQGAIILSLAIANSIEHIDLLLSDTLDDLERRSAMGFALAASQSIISEPQRMEEPDEIAAMFSEFIRDPMDNELDWEPAVLPAHFFDFYPSTQALESQRTAGTTQSNGRKRLLVSGASLIPILEPNMIQDGDDRMSTPSKRAKTTHTTLTQTTHLMSDLLKNTLASYSPRSRGTSHTVEVAIDQLEWMAAKIARLEANVADKEKVQERLRETVYQKESQLQSFEKTVQKLHPKYKQAISDRGVFELRMNAAEKRLAKVQEDLDVSKVEVQALKAKLEGQTKSNEDALTDPEVELEEAQTKIAALEKKIKSANHDLEFIRERYQAASSSAAELGTENADLKTKIKALEQRASEITLRIHEINSKNKMSGAQHRIDELQATIAQRDQHLDTVMKELRTLKSGRRETRQSSVPRSPRLNVMSPRTRGNGGTSRGTSPAPFDGSSTPSSVAGTAPGGLSFYQPPGSHRFSHLRE